MKALFLAAFAATLATPALAHAAPPDAAIVEAAPDAGAAVQPAVPPAVPSTDDPGVLLRDLVDAGQGGEWWIVGALAAVLATWVLRKIVVPVVPWFASDRGGAVLALVVGLLGAVSITFAAGRPSWGAIVDGVKLALLAIGTFVAGKKLASPSDLRKIAGPVAILVAAGLALGACNPVQTTAWKKLGVDAAACSAPGVSATIDQGKADAIAKLTGAQITLDQVKAQGIDLVARYGSSLAWCILQAAWADLGPVVFGGAPDGDPRPRVKWLLDHPGEWVPKGQALHRLRLIAEFLAPRYE